MKPQFVRITGMGWNPVGVATVVDSNYNLHIIIYSSSFSSTISKPTVLSFLVFLKVCLFVTNSHAED